MDREVKAVSTILALLLGSQLCLWTGSVDALLTPPAEECGVSFIEPLNVCDEGPGYADSARAKFWLPDASRPYIHTAGGGSFQAAVPGRLTDGHPRQVFKPPRNFRVQDNILTKQTSGPSGHNQGENAIEEQM